MLPEHTMEGYLLAIQQGADYIECDLSVTSDLHLICVHESWIKHTSDVESHPEFYNRLRRYVVDNKTIVDYFTVDFTLAELMTLRKVQQHPYRDQSYNGQFQLATFEAYVQLAQREGVGIYPEVKNPAWHNGLALLTKQQTRVEDLLLEALRTYGYTTSTHSGHISPPCFVQSFSEDSLTYMWTRAPMLQIIQLTEVREISDITLQRWSDKSFYGIGMSKESIIPVWTPSHLYKNKVGSATTLVARCHALGLHVHPYTFRNEDRYLANTYGQDVMEEYALFSALGIDGYFTDFPATLDRFLN